MQEHENRRCMLVGGSQAEREALQDHRHGQFRLQNGQVLADAAAAAEPKWEERDGILGCTGDAMGEPSGVEWVSVLAPQCRVVMDGYDWDEELGPTGDHHTPSEVDVGFGPSDRRHRWRVQS